MLNILYIYLYIYKPLNRLHFQTELLDDNVVNNIDVISYMSGKIIKIVNVDKINQIN